MWTIYISAWASALLFLRYEGNARALRAGESNKCSDPRFFRGENEVNNKNYVLFWSLADTIRSCARHESGQYVMCTKMKEMFSNSLAAARALFGVLLLLSFSLTFTACSGDDEDGGAGGSAVPEKLGVCTFTWDEHYHIVSGPDAGKSSGDLNQKLLIFNETDCQASWSVDRGTYRYAKTGGNTARLSFSVARNVVGHVQSWQYTLDLTFTSKGKFTMTGSKVITSNMNGTTRCEIYEGEGTLEEGLNRD